MNIGDQTEATESPVRRGAVFLDRDGVLNEDHGHVMDVERFRWIAGAPLAIKTANDFGLYVFVVSNQSGVARGYYAEEDVRRLHEHMRSDLKKFGASIDDFRYCPHHPDAVDPHYAQTCDCRKPKPGMLLDLMANWPVDPARSVMIGDRYTDVEAGREAGIAAYHLRGGQNLQRVIDELLKQLKKGGPLRAQSQEA